MTRRVVQVVDEDWESQFDAAERLKVSMWAIGAHIASDRLTPAENPAGHAGLMRMSVDAEAEWRRDRSIAALFWRSVKDQLRFF